MHDQYNYDNNGHDDDDDDENSSYDTKLDYNHVHKGYKIFAVCPIRFSSCYFLIDNNSNSKWNNLLDFMTFIANKMTRLRTRAIRGSKQECKYGSHNEDSKCSSQ